MPWLSNLFNKFTNKHVDVAGIRQKLETASATESDLNAYVDDIESRRNAMVKELKSLYKKYNITFTGFKSLDLACEYLRESINNGTEAAHNNLIKLESIVTSEQQRHLALIRMAITPSGQRVMEQINQNPDNKQTFNKVFGTKDATGRIIEDGAYQHLWSEIHKLSEYLLVQKAKIYH